MSRTIQDAVAEVKAAFPECEIEYTIEGLSGQDPISRYSEDANGMIVWFQRGPVNVRIHLCRDLAEDDRFNVIGYVRSMIERSDRHRRPLDGMRTKSITDTESI